MNYSPVKTPLAIAIALSISIVGLTGCSTQESKVDSIEETSESIKPSPTIELESGLKADLEVDVIRSEKTTVTSLMKERKKQFAQKLVSTMDQLHPSVMPRKHFIGNSPQAMNDRENYAHLEENAVMQVTKTPVSTFSIDVDTGAYTNVRRILNQGRLPRTDAIRTEEFINYFNYDFEPPTNKDVPFAVHSDMMKSPWSEGSYLLQLGIKAWQPLDEPRPAANLVFLMDVSGSMNSADKLGLLKKSLAMLTRQLSSNDRISMVVYAGASGVVLEPTAGNQTATIELALERLKAGGSTNGASGINLAYKMAEKSFIKGGINRILLATDGDFNVGTTNFNALIDLVEEKRKSGIALSTLGFGSGNYNDHLMEQLADKGNGQYSYIDSLMEAKKVLVDELDSSLLTVAADVKIQMEFNPQVVSEYRLIGYENRVLAREDFNNDKVDAGDIGAGHTVTALYEVRFTDSNNLSVDKLRYSSNSKVDVYRGQNTGELGFLKLRYKNPGESKSQLIEQPLVKNELMQKTLNPSKSIQFATSVAGFAQQLRGAKYLENFSYQQIAQLAQAAKGDDQRGLRSEFLQLVSLAELLSQKSETTITTQSLSEE